MAHLLSQYDLVPEARQLLAKVRHHYILDGIDGPTFRRQRQLLSSLASLAREGKAYEANDGDQELLDGLVNFTGVIADQAHDNHG